MPYTGYFQNCIIFQDPIKWPEDIKPEFKVFVIQIMKNLDSREQISPNWPDETLGTTFRISLSMETCLVLFGSVCLSIMKFFFTFIDEKPTQKDRFEEMSTHGMDRKLNVLFSYDL